MENITLGNLTLITGSNGSGKTRYIKSISPDEGHVLKYYTYGYYSYGTEWEGWAAPLNPLKPLIPFGLEENSKYPINDWLDALFPQRDRNKDIRSQGDGFYHGFSMIEILIHAKAGDTVILENPELYLHPNAQSRLAELCVLVSNAGIRVVIETHGENICNGILIGAKRHRLIAKDIFKIWYLDRRDDEEGYTATEIVIGDNHRIRNAPDGFFDQFAKDLRVLMSSRNI